MLPFSWCKYHFLSEASSACISLSLSKLKEINSSSQRLWHVTCILCRQCLLFSKLFAPEKKICVCFTSASERTFKTMLGRYINYSVKCSFVNTFPREDTREMRLPWVLDCRTGKEAFSVLGSELSQRLWLFTAPLFVSWAQCPTPHALEKSKQSSDWVPWKPPDLAFLGKGCFRVTWWLCSLVT